MATLTATLRPDPLLLSTVLLSTDPLPAARLVDVTRDPPGPAGVVVRGTPRTIDAGGALLLVDTELPLTGGTVTYRLTERDPGTGAVVSTSSASVTVPDAPPDSGHVLSDPITGRAVVVPVVDQSDEVAGWAGASLRLAGVDTPLVLSGVRASWAWTLTVRTGTAAAAAALDELLRASDRLLVRHTDASCFLRDGWVTVYDVDVSRVTVPGEDARRDWRLPVQTVAAPESTVEGAAATLLDMHEYEPSTLSTLSTRAASLLALSVAVQESD